jgi:L-ascorbate metabolism protein UlaG (beta-lactamase superfamily)
MIRRIAAAAVAAPVLVFGGGVASFEHTPWERPAEWAPPERQPLEGMEIRFLGVSGYVISDDRTTLVLDPALNRYTLAELATGPVTPDAELSAALVPEADYILVNHAHHDHSVDMPEIALRTGATVIGSPSTCALARSRGVPRDQTREVVGGETLHLGSFTVQVRAGVHGPIMGVDDPMSGVIPEDAGPLWFFDYTQDGTLAFHLESRGEQVWFHPASTFHPGDLGGLTADTLIMGVNGAGASPEGLAAAVAEAQPERVLPTHYDNFFQPRSLGLALFPGIDLEGKLAWMRESGVAFDWIVMDYDEVITVSQEEDAPAGG